MEIKKRIVGGTVIIDLPDDMGSSTGDEFTKTINDLLDRGHRQFVINLARVLLFDSAGLGKVVRAYTTVSRRGGTLRLEGLNPRLKDELRLTKLSRWFGLSTELPTDPFNPDLGGTYRKALVAGGGFILFVIVLKILWTWGGLFDSR